MATKVGVGFSENSDSQEAGLEAARAAVSEAGIPKCDLAIMYSTSKHDPVQLRDGVRSVIGPAARLIGGYSIGIITRDELAYEGYQTDVENTYRPSQTSFSPSTDAMGSRKPGGTGRI